MKKVRVALLVLALFSSPVEAHKDRLLPVAADGSISGIPTEFGRVRLIVEGLGSEKPFIQLRIGANQMTLPSCVSSRILTSGMAGVRVTGSWYHDEEDSLPYYLNIHFFDPGYDPRRSYNSSQEFLFNLHNAKLIHAEAFEADQSGNGGQFGKLKLPLDCTLDVDS
jgi:hypothetical protein